MFSTTAIVIITLIIIYPLLKHMYHKYIKTQRDYDVYVINMRKDKKRYKKITKELNKYNVKFRKIEGIDGSKQNINLLKNKKLIDHNADDSLSLPKVGCSWSHKKTWIDAYNNKDSYNDIIVIEDNVKLNHKFKDKLNKIAYELRGIQYDICYLGRKPLSEDYKSREKNLSKHVTTASKSEGTYGYIINRDSLPRLLGEFKTLDHKPDELWNNGKFKVVASNVDLVNK